MFVGPALYRVLLWSGPAVSLIIVVISAVVIERATLRRNRLPAAELVKRRSQLARAVGRVAAVAGIVGGLAAGWWVYRHGTDVVLVTGSAAAPQADRRVWLGERHHYDLSAIAWSENPYHGSNPTWVVNESAGPVMLVNVAYGETAPSAPTAVAPGTYFAEESVDYIGPDDLPPAEITVSDSNGRSAHYGHQTWLTWGLEPR